MEDINLPIPKLDNNSTREDVIKAFEVFQSNYKFLRSLEDKNSENYSSFVNEHRKTIRKFVPIVGNVYEFTNVCKEAFSFSSPDEDLFPVIKYAYINFVAIRKDDRWANFSIKAKVIPLNENGEIIKYKRNYGNGLEEFSVDEKEVYFNFLSAEPNNRILMLYKNHLRKNDKKEKILYEKLKQKFES